MASLHPERLRRFIADFTALADAAPPEAAILADGGALLAALVRHDDWLPEAFAKPDPARYSQYLLYCDPQARFSVVSFVWGPGQCTPIHDHTVWGLVGVLRGAEISQRLVKTPDGGLVRDVSRRLTPGQVETLSPAEGDIHQVCNAYPDRVSISIHVYGADIGAVRRSAFDPSGKARPFISGYSNAPVAAL
jgi:predicted metal-dependent enzyme (double-stranded beta helix superfamily)